MAKTKYKIRLSFTTYYTLLNDMYTFNFIKENGDPNQNNFYNTLISSYYNNLKYRYNEINDYIFNELYSHIKDKNKISKIANSLNTDYSRFFEPVFCLKWAINISYLSH